MDYLACRPWDFMVSLINNRERFFDMRCSVWEDL